MLNRSNEVKKRNTPMFLWLKNLRETLRTSVDGSNEVALNGKRTTFLFWLHQAWPKLSPDLPKASPVRRLKLETVRR